MGRIEPKYKLLDRLIFVGDKDDWKSRLVAEIYQIEEGYFKYLKPDGPKITEQNSPCIWYYLDFGDNITDHWHHEFIEGPEWRLATSEEILLYGQSRY